MSLTRFPFMHSDEAWLASLSRTILVEQDIGATEDFFHEIDRYPHAIKSMFHLLQIPFVSVCFSLGSVRSLSFVAGLIALFFLFKAAEIIFNDKRVALAVLFLVALDTQFMYISHFARQEILLVMVFTICLYVFYRPAGFWRFRRDMVLGGVLGASIALHPNVFIIASGFVALYFFLAVTRAFSKESEAPSFLNMGLFLLILGLFGLLFVGLSMIMDPDFLNHYLNFGAEHGVGNPLPIKLLKLPRFYGKLFFRLSGTYYLPDIRPQMIMFAASLCLSIPASIVFRKERTRILTLLVLLLGIQAGMVMIGKYSPPSIIFIFLPGYLLTFALVKALFISRAHIISATLVLSVAAAVFTMNQMLPLRVHNYDSYIGRIRNTVPEAARTLANLNTGFAFAPEALYSYRDLAGIEPTSGFRDYVSKHEIEYIVYSDELRIIFDERPVWNTMYGNIYPWYEELMDFLRNECDMITSWIEPVFGMRITGYMGSRDGTIAIYRVRSSP